MEPLVFKRGEHEADRYTGSRGRQDSLRGTNKRLISCHYASSVIAINFSRARLLRVAGASSREIYGRRVQ